MRTVEDNRVGAAEVRASASGIAAVRTRSELERLYRLSDNKNGGFYARGLCGQQQRGGERE